MHCGVPLSSPAYDDLADVCAGVLVAQVVHLERRRGPKHTEVRPLGPVGPRCMPTLHDVGAMETLVACVCHAVHRYRRVVFEPIDLLR